MNKFVRLAALAAVATAVATPAYAVGPVTQVTTSKAKILKALELEKHTDVDFGTIVIGAVATTETVKVTKTGRTCGLGAGSQLVCDSSAAYSPGWFTVRGSNNQLVNISVPDTVTMTSGGNSLVVDLTAPTSLTLTSSGTPGDDFWIDGSVALAASTPEGDYTVNFDVTVEY